MDVKLDNFVIGRGRAGSKKVGAFPSQRWFAACIPPSHCLMSFWILSDTDVSADVAAMRILSSVKLSELKTKMC